MCKLSRLFVAPHGPLLCCSDASHQPQPPQSPRRPSGGHRRGSSGCGTLHRIAFVQTARSYPLAFSPPRSSRPLDLLAAAANTTQRAVTLQSPPASRPSHDPSATKLVPESAMRGLRAPGPDACTRVASSSGRRQPARAHRAAGPQRAAPTVVAFLKGEQPSSSPEGAAEARNRQAEVARGEGEGQRAVWPIRALPPSGCAAESSRPYHTPEVRPPSTCARAVGQPAALELAGKPRLTVSWAGGELGAARACRVGRRAPRSGEKRSGWAGGELRVTVRMSVQPSGVTLTQPALAPASPLRPPAAAGVFFFW